MVASTRTYRATKAPRIAPGSCFAPVLCDSHMKKPEGMASILAAAYGFPQFVQFSEYGLHGRRGFDRLATKESKGDCCIERDCPCVGVWKEG